MFLHERPSRVARRPPCCEESLADGEASDSDASARAGTPPEAWAPRVRFRDAALAEIVEVESWKEYFLAFGPSRHRAWVGGVLGPSWAILGASWALLARLGPLFGPKKQNH